MKLSLILLTSRGLIEKIHSSILIIGRALPRTTLPRSRTVPTATTTRTMMGVWPATHFLRHPTTTMSPSFSHLDTVVQNIKPIRFIIDCCSSLVCKYAVEPSILRYFIYRNKYARPMWKYPRIYPFSIISKSSIEAAFFSTRSSVKVANRASGSWEEDCARLVDCSSSSLCSSSSRRRNLLLISFQTRTHHRRKKILPTKAAIGLHTVTELLDVRSIKTSLLPQIAPAAPKTSNMNLMMYANRHDETSLH